MRVQVCQQGAVAFEHSAALLAHHGYGFAAVDMGALHVHSAARHAGQLPLAQIALEVALLWCMSRLMVQVQVARRGKFLVAQLARQRLTGVVVQLPVPLQLFTVPVE